MREILFRAKRIDNGKWVEGTPYQEYVEFWKEWEWFIQTKHPLTNVPYMHLEIDRKTICEFTGLTDKNGKKIFEGDILDHTIQAEVLTNRGVVVLDSENARWALQLNTMKPCFYMHNPKAVEVIGNIHDNPELLEKPLIPS